MNDRAAPTRTYAVHLAREDGRWVARAPGLRVNAPGVHPTQVVEAAGTTREQAITRVMGAVEGHLRERAAAGLPLPPSDAGAIVTISVRVPRRRPAKRAPRATTTYAEASE